jgi:tricorn protease
MKSRYLFLGLLLGFTFSIAAYAQGTRLLRRPSISHDSIAFAYGGDLWVVSRNGGEARRLTATPEVESDPCISPDGAQIVYTAMTGGNTDVYVMPVQGGSPTRLTYHPEFDTARGWTPDSRRVVFASSRDTSPSGVASSYVRLWTIGAEGGFPEALPMPSAYSGSISSDGEQIAYEEISTIMMPSLWAESQTSQWRHYRGGRIP